MDCSIRKKITQHLTSPIDTECKVVYLLCELRKLYDGERTGIPLSLQMCIDWALHVTLHGDGARTFLLKVDKFVESFLDNNKDILYEHEMSEEFLFVGEFKEALRDFLASEGLPTDLCDDGQKWHSFIATYSGVIEDGSLKCRSSAALKFVSEVKFSKGREIENCDLPFELNWEIRLQDGRLLKSSFSKNSEKKFTMHSTELVSAA